jgi:LmbE family N-acetylglucosaminyl deacetylase
VVAAHPDDEVIGCGGTMAEHALSGRPVHVLLMTDGVGARDETAPPAGAVSERADAARLAANILGVHEPRMHSFPDNAMDTTPLLEVIRAVEAYVTELRPQTVYTHHRGDLNIDHEIVHRAVLAACRPQPGHPVKEIHCFGVRSSTEWSGPFPGSVFAPSLYVDISRTLEVKMKALGAYSQEMRDPPHTRSMAAIEAEARTAGATVGLAAAEAFEVVRIVRDSVST